MTNEDFIEIYTNSSPLKKLELLMRTLQTLTSDTIERVRAVNNGGSAETIRYLSSECKAMEDRGAWLYGEIEKALLTQEPRVLTLQELLACDNDTPVYLEQERIAYWCLRSETFSEKLLSFANYGSGTCVFYLDDYGRTWRCWNTKPDPEQMEQKGWNTP